MNILQWVEDFKVSWVQKDIDSVINLFTEDVEYWESPFKRIDSIEKLRNEWSVISEQTEIKLNTSIFGEQDNRFSIIWDLNYINKFGDINIWAGVYLIRLNDDGKCIYFYQTGEVKKVNS